MSRKKKPLPLLEQIEITGVAAEGKALARVDGMVVFVPFAVPGDVADLQLTRKKHSYAEAEVVRFHKLSAMRAKPFCRHFGVCGGCKWQLLPYSEQLLYKQQQVHDALERIGKVSVGQWLPILGSAQQREYRNKLEFGFSNKKWLTRAQIESGEAFADMNALGFHITGAFDKILDIEECCLMDNVNNRLRNGIRRYALSHGLTFFDLQRQEGLLRGMMIRLANLPEADAPEAAAPAAESGTTGGPEVMVLLQFHWTSAQEEAQARALMDWIRGEFPEVTSLLYVNNLKCNDTIGDLDVETFSGADHIVEHMEGLRFKVGPKSFYQTNTHQAYELYRVARSFAGLTGTELVYDLYTGTGTIANFVARKARRVIGIEYVPEAIADARVNAELNQLTDRTAFFAGDMKDILNDEFVAEHGRPDVIITDPPRAGMHPDVIRVILRAAPQRIVYVSCNPATQARDLQLLTAEADYSISKAQPVDMFPQTQHVENVVLLERTDKAAGQ